MAPRNPATRMRDCWCIEGIVTGARLGQQIVLYAKSGRWWVQPAFQRPRLCGVVLWLRWRNGLLRQHGRKPPKHSATAPRPAA